MNRGWNAVAIVGGGMLGTAVRATGEAAFPAITGGWPWTTFAINVVGSLLLGALLEGLAASGPDTGWRRTLRLGVGTGVLGGFTTYSTYSVETIALLSQGLWLTAVGYAALSLVAGVGAAMVGILLFRRIRPNQEAA